MSAQTNYNFATTYGVAGGIADLAPHAVDTFINGEETGTMKFGVGVFSGTTKGVDVVLPTSESTAATFEGIATNNHTTEYDLEGKLNVRKDAAVGVLRYGRIYVRVATGVTPAIGDALYIVKSGDEAGFATNASTGIAVKGRFIGKLDTVGGVAEVELFNQAQA